MTHRRLASLLSNKLKRKYSDMCGFVSARMSIAIVISNTLLLRGFKDKEAYIYQIPDLDDVAVMELLAPWRVLVDKG